MSVLWFQVLRSGLSLVLSQKLRLIARKGPIILQPQEGVSFHEVAKEIDMVLSFPDTRDGFHQVYSRRNKGDEVSGGTRRI